MGTLVLHSDQHGSHTALPLPSPPHLLFSGSSSDGEDGSANSGCLRDCAVGSAMNVVFQLSSWFTDYETAPYTIMMHDDGVEERLYPARRWVCTKKTSRADDTDPKSGMFWSLFKY